MIDEVKAGSWLHRQLSTWDRLAPAQQALLTRLQLTPANPLTPARPASPPTAKRRRRSFEQNAQILQLFVEHWNRPPGAREWIEIDGERIMIGPWLCKARTRRDAGQLAKEQDDLMARILPEAWTALVPE
ncbi:hypothetical protein ACWDRX_38985 [Streptomyces nigra]|uniref:hypothetical protein n=1 Tax=Streptomyces nigra TaxID=1827580 RepID=UPI0036375210